VSQAVLCSQHYLQICNCFSFVPCVLWVNLLRLFLPFVNVKQFVRKSVDWFDTLLWNLFSDWHMLKPECVCHRQYCAHSITSKFAIPLVLCHVFCG